MWVIIMIIGFLMIIGLIVVWSRQKKTESRDSIKDSLLTVASGYQDHINRSSVDPNSVRGTVDYSNEEKLDSKTNKMQKENRAEEEKSDNSEIEIHRQEADEEKSDNSEIYIPHR